MALTIHSGLAAHAMTATMLHPTLSASMVEEVKSTVKWVTSTADAAAMHIGQMVEHEARLWQVTSISGTVVMAHGPHGYVAPRLRTVASEVEHEMKLKLGTTEEFIEALDEELEKGKEEIDRIRGRWTYAL